MSPTCRRWRRTAPPTDRPRGPGRDHRRVPRTVPDLLHVDADAFFAAVEQRDRPSLRGRPVVVGGLGPRGVVATASYEARALGIRSAMPMWQARRLASGRTAFLYPRGEAYRQSSERVMAILRGRTPLVEPVSLDEAYADLAAAEPPPASRDEVLDAVRGLRAQVRTQVGVTVSVGAATSRSVAKIASDAAKPDGFLVIDPGGERDFLAPHPVRALQGVGPVTGQQLTVAGIATVGDLAALDREDAVRLLGSDHLWRLAHGDDPRPVVPPGPAKSLSVETTFDRDLVSAAELRDRLDGLALRLVERMREAGVAATGVTVKARFADFRTVTRAAGVGGSTTESSLLVAASRRALADLAASQDLSLGVRLLGVGVHGLADHEQPPLFAPEDAPVGPGDGAGADAGLAPAVDPMPWWPGRDVVHRDLGRGWVQGCGQGIVTVRFETRADVRPGPVRSLPATDPLLVPAEPEPLPVGPRSVKGEG